MTQSRERKVTEFIESIEKIYQMPEKEQQQALEEKRGELLEDIFPISPITPEDNFCQMQEIRITKEGFIQPNPILLDCVARKIAPNGIRILTEKDIFQSDTLQIIQQTIQKINQTNLALYATNNQLATLAPQVMAYEKQNAELAKEIAHYTFGSVGAALPSIKVTTTETLPIVKELSADAFCAKEKVDPIQKSDTPSPKEANELSVDDFFSWEEKADFYISNQGKIYWGPGLPAKDPKNPTIVKSYTSSDLNKIHEGYKILHLETLLLQQKEKALQHFLPLKAKLEALKKENQILLEKVGEAKKKRQIENKKKKEARQKERRKQGKTFKNFVLQALDMGPTNYDNLFRNQSPFFIYDIIFYLIMTYDQFMNEEAKKEGSILGKKFHTLLIYLVRESIDANYAHYFTLLPASPPITPLHFAIAQNALVPVEILCKYHARTDIACQLTLGAAPITAYELAKGKDEKIEKMVRAVQNEEKDQGNYRVPIPYLSQEDSPEKEPSPLEIFIFALQSADLSRIRKNNCLTITSAEQCHELLNAVSYQKNRSDILNLLLDELGHSPQKLLFGLIDFITCLGKSKEQRFVSLFNTALLFSILINHPKMQAYLNLPYEYFFCDSNKMTPLQFALSCHCKPAIMELERALTKNSEQKISTGIQEGLNFFSPPEQRIANNPMFHLAQTIAKIAY